VPRAEAKHTVVIWEPAWPGGVA